MAILKAILTTLQQNAEWLCAIAIAYFAWKQYAITKLQIQQDLRMRRLELAQKLDEACKAFPLQREDAIRLSTWMLAHNSEFLFLLKEKDCQHFARLLGFTCNLQKKYTTADYQASDADLKTFVHYVRQVDLALGNAKYGLREIK